MLRTSLRTHTSKSISQTQSIEGIRSDLAACYLRFRSSQSIRCVSGCWISNKNRAENCKWLTHVPHEGQKSHERPAIHCNVQEIIPCTNSARLERVYQGV
jgi:hypothetical protein